MICFEVLRNGDCGAVVECVVDVIRIGHESHLVRARFACVAALPAALAGWRFGLRQACEGVFPFAAT